MRLKRLPRALNRRAEATCLVGSQNRDGRHSRMSKTAALASTNSRLKQSLRMVPGAGIEPARCCHRGILSPLRLPISPSGHNAAMRLTFGGWGRNRTGVNGVAVRCMTTLPPSHLVNQRRLNYSNIRNILHVFIASSLVVIPFSTKNLSAKKVSQ